MYLDMHTIAAVNIAVTGVLGLVLLFTWARGRADALVGWWGLSQLVMSAGILVAAVAALRNQTDFVVIGAVTMILADALKWKAARQFEHRPARPLWVVAGPIAFFLAAHSGLVETFTTRLALGCTIVSAYNFAAAIEVAQGKNERLGSRGPAVALLVIIGMGYLFWLLLNMTMPIGRAQLVFTSTWFAPVVLIAVLCRVALAFVVLALAKDRGQLQQRVEALTDPLTGLPNRRALIEAAGELERRGSLLEEDQISVLLFDLDHFKKINDVYGHRLGDDVLRLFATTLTEQMDGKSIIGRLGGEEFAAILPGVHSAGAVGIAESVRAAFEASATMVDGVAVGSTVSVGAACDALADCDLGTLFHRADAALYRAKSAGRNRVELVGPDASDGSSRAESAAEAAIIEYQRRVSA